MVLNKHCRLADKAANFYRAALYLGQGDRKTGLMFLKKTGFKPIPKPTSQKQDLVLAEKALDEYHRLRFSLQ